MHIGLLIYGSLETVSGGYLYDRELVRYLRRAGEKVEIVSLPWLYYGRHLTHNFSSALYRRLRNASFDLLLQDELNHPSLFWLNGRLRRHVRYPLVSIVHHLRSSEARAAWKNRLYRYVEQRYLNTIDGFIFNSHTTRSAVTALLQRPRPHVVAYPAGNHLPPMIERKQITARAWQPGPLRLLFVGNLIPRKGLHTLLAALARLAPAKWRLAVVGNTAVDPAYTQQIKRQIETANLAPSVTLHDALPDPALAALMAQSHLLAVPSSYEGFGIVYLEGMGFGLPAIATTSGAAHEIITPGRDGFLIAPGEAGSLARHIDDLYHNRGQLAQMSVAARHRYEVHPTWEESAATIAQFLSSLLGK